VSTIRYDASISSREWTDSQWTSVNAVQKGIDDVTQEQRLTLFDKNEIDIEGKSTVSLLVEEVYGPKVTMSFLSLKYVCIIDHSSLLRVSNCQLHSVVFG
jgi:hypothetical protein